MSSDVWQRFEEVLDYWEDEDFTSEDMHFLMFADWDSLDDVTFVNRIRIDAVFRRRLWRFIDGFSHLVVEKQASALAALLVRLSAVVLRFTLSFTEESSKLPREFWSLLLIARSSAAIICDPTLRIIIVGQLTQVSFPLRLAPPEIEKLLEIRFHLSPNTQGLHSTNPAISLSSTPTIRGKLKARVQCLLDQCKSGTKHATLYEVICGWVFFILFEDRISMPKFQKTTFDGLLRRDVLFHINEIEGFWQLVTSRYSSHSFVLEAKNISSSLGQDEVTQIAGYMYPPFTFLGILCTRGKVNDNAYLRCYSFYRQDRKRIIILNDDHILEMCERFDRGDAPDDVLVQQEREFVEKYLP